MGVDAGEDPEFVEPGAPFAASGVVPASGETADAPSGRVGSAFAVEPPCRA